MSFKETRDALGKPPLGIQLEEFGPDDQLGRIVPVSRDQERNGAAPARRRRFAVTPAATV